MSNSYSEVRPIAFVRSEVHHAAAGMTARAWRNPEVLAASWLSRGFAWLSHFGLLSGIIVFEISSVLFASCFFGVCGVLYPVLSSRAPRAHLVQ